MVLISGNGHNGHLMDRPSRLCHLSKDTWKESSLSISIEEDDQNNSGSAPPELDGDHTQQENRKAGGQENGKTGGGESSKRDPLGQRPTVVATGS